MKKIIFTFFLAILFSTNNFSQEKLTWHTDINNALEVAVKENKKVMLFFTGSDWCGWCTKIQNDVFRAPDFEKWSDEVVLVELDFPRRTAQDPKVKAQNRQLQSMFKVRGFPTIHFVNPEKSSNGKLNLKNIGQVGYVRGGAKKWIEVADNIVQKAI